MLDHSPARIARPRPAGRHRNEGTAQMAGPFLWITEFNDPIALERALRDLFKARRPVSIDDRGHKYPETIVHEVAQIATTLHNESKRYKDNTKPSKLDLILGGPAVALAHHLGGRDDDYAGHKDAVDRFDRYVKELRAELKNLTPTATYPGNATFWHEAERLVTRLGVAKDNPLIQKSFADSLAHGAKKLPETLSKTAEAISRAALAPVREVGDELTRTLKSLALPAAIVTGGLIGVVLLARSRDRDGGS